MRLKYLKIAMAVSFVAAQLAWPGSADAGPHGGGGGHGGGFGGGFGGGGHPGGFGGGGHPGGFGAGPSGFGHGHGGGLPMERIGPMGMRGDMPGVRMSPPGPSWHARGYGLHNDHLSRSMFHRGGGYADFPRGGRSYESFHALHGGISQRHIRAATLAKAQLGNPNGRQIAADRSLQHATLAPHNAFFNRAFVHKPDGDHKGDHDWKDRWGRWQWRRWWGPVFWPYWFGDYYSYAFWPDDYYEPFWGYGPDAILWGAFWPYGDAYYDGDAQTGDIYRPYRHRTTRAPADEATIAPTDTCAGFAPGVGELPIDELGKILDATEEQRAAFADLKSATIRASEIVKNACPTETALTPVARLDAMQRRLQAMSEANETVKAPLAHLYDLLSPAQKERLAKLGQPARKSRSKDASIAALCSSQATFTNVPVERIATVITLTDAQKQELDKLKDASGKASQSLKEACPAQTPETIEGRLDAAQQRLTALIAAIDTVRPALSDFYASLTDEQKAKLSIQRAAKEKTATRK